MAKLLPDQPAFGAPCNGCGLCCAREVCAIGRLAFGDVPPPCPGLTYAEGRLWCRLVLVEQAAGLAPVLATALGIGRGCDASFEETS